MSNASSGVGETAVLLLGAVFFGGFVERVAIRVARDDVFSDPK